MHAWQRLAALAARHGDRSAEAKVATALQLARELGWSAQKFEEVAVGLLDWEGLALALCTPAEELRQRTLSELLALADINDALQTHAASGDTLGTPCGNAGEAAR